MTREIQYDEVFDAQKHYRILLDSMARPGKIGLLSLPELNPPAGIHGAGALTGFALLNADAGFTVFGDEKGNITDYLALNTAARPVGHALADFLFLPGGKEWPEIKELKTGTLSYPEDSATLVIAAAEISAFPLTNAVVIILKGPGVEGEKKIYISGLHVSILETLQIQNLEFPLGLDAIVTDKKDQIVCIPRTSKLTIMTS